LPLDYLDANPKEKALAALANTQGVLEMYRVKEEQKDSSVLLYVPFQPLSGDRETSIEGRVANLKALISNGAYEDSITLSHELLAVGLAGLRYLQTYDWLFLRTIVSFGYLGWIAYALTTVIDLHVLYGTSESHRTTASISFYFVYICGAVLCYFVPWIFMALLLLRVLPCFLLEGRLCPSQGPDRRPQPCSRPCSLFLGDVSFGLQLVAFLGVLEALVCSPLSLSFLAS
jgi:phosphatidylinositol glycan class N